MQKNEFISYNVEVQLNHLKLKYIIFIGVINLLYIKQNYTKFALQKDFKRGILHV